MGNEAPQYRVEFSLSKVDEADLVHVLDELRRTRDRYSKWGSWVSVEPIDRLVN